MASWLWKLPDRMRSIGTAKVNVRKRYPKAYSMHVLTHALLPSAGLTFKGREWQIWSSLGEDAKCIGTGSTSKEAWLCAARGWE